MIVMIKTMAGDIIRYEAIRRFNLAGCRWRTPKHGSDQLVAWGLYADLGTDTGDTTTKLVEAPTQKKLQRAVRVFCAELAKRQDRENRRKKTEVWLVSFKRILSAV